MVGDGGDRELQGADVDLLACTVALVASDHLNATNRHGVVVTGSATAESQYTSGAMNKRREHVIFLRKAGE